MGDEAGSEGAISSLISEIESALERIAPFAERNADLIPPEVREAMVREASAAGEELRGLRGDLERRGWRLGPSEARELEWLLEQILDEVRGIPEQFEGLREAAHQLESLPEEIRRAFGALGAAGLMGRPQVNQEALEGKRKEVEGLMGVMATGGLRDALAGVRGQLEDLRRRLSEGTLGEL